MRGSGGSVLTVRKYNSSSWILPGGKPEKNESERQTLIRELREELGALVPSSSLAFRGIAVAPASNERDTTVIASVYD
ncbi:NUDIX domain-containing protein [Corynebacterium falsenii]|uniref:NUDIX domain-containing protein n=1 Tax=Corynebacterium falsenii TaxID=108486 RepID=UPI003FCFD4BA